MTRVLVTGANGLVGPPCRLGMLRLARTLSVRSATAHRALALLAESVAEYQADPDIRDYVWTRKAVLPHAPAAKVADFAAKRRPSEAAKPTQGQNPVA